MNTKISMSCLSILILASLMAVGEGAAVMVLQEEVIEPHPVQAEQDPADEVEYLPRVEGWTCYDYSMEYGRLHPEYGMLVISDNARFQGMNHMVNFKVNSDKSLATHDELLQTEYTNKGWQYDTFTYYHFYINGEQPTRNYRYLLPNAGEFYDTL